MLPNDHHPGPRCSCDECAGNYPDVPKVAPQTRAIELHGDGQGYTTHASQEAEDAEDRCNNCRLRFFEALEREIAEEKAGRRAGQVQVRELRAYAEQLAEAGHNAEVALNVVEALLDVDASYDGPRVTFTFLSTDDAMSYIQRARSIVRERVEMVRAALAKNPQDGK